MRKTYMINIDGMRADYFGARDDRGSLTPTLDFLAESGMIFTNCKVPLPAVTSTNHASILTSTNLDTHGIYGMISYFKGLYDAQLPRFSPRHKTAQLDFYTHDHLGKIKTFFNLIKENNSDAKTALIVGKHWVGKLLGDQDCDVVIYATNTENNPSYVTTSEGYVLGGLRHEGDAASPPRIYIPKKGDFLSRPPAGTKKMPLREVNADTLPSDTWIMDQVIKTISQEDFDPDFMYILLPDVDTAGHFYGSFSDSTKPNLNKLINPDAMKDQLAITDTEINRFVTFLNSRKTEDGKNALKEARIIITSDHGMSSMKNLSNAVDIRKTLSAHGIDIRANTKWFTGGYNPQGKYDWCFSEGTHSYIYCEENEIERIRNTLQKELGHLHMIYDKDLQEKNNMWKDDYDNVIWPKLIVFLKQNYMNTFYPDGLPKLTHSNPNVQSIVAKLFDFKSVPGTHGTISEQDVPLIFVSPEEISEGKSEEEVSVLDIVPTLNHLNGWPGQPSFEGKVLPFKEVTSKRKKKKPEIPSISEPSNGKSVIIENVIQKFLRWLFSR